MAALADGVPPDKVYPLDVDRAFASLEKIKPHISVWWDSGGQAMQLMKDGEVDMACDLERPRQRARPPKGRR